MSQEEFPKFVNMYIAVYSEATQDYWINIQSFEERNEMIFRREYKSDDGTIYRSQGYGLPELPTSTYAATVFVGDLAHGLGKLHMFLCRQLQIEYDEMVKILRDALSKNLPRIIWVRWANWMGAVSHPKDHWMIFSNYDDLQVSRDRYNELLKEIKSPWRLKTPKTEALLKLIAVQELQKELGAK